MSFLDRLFGRQPDQPAPRPAAGGGAPANRPVELTDEQAIERYRYLLRTAPPEAIEQAHEEAFAQLTPAQRAQVLDELSQTLPAHERAGAAAGQSDPRTLARLATRAELRQPGTLERTFGGMGGGMMGGGMMGGMGGMMAGSILASLAAGFVGSMIAHGLYDALMPDDPALGESGHGPGEYGDQQYGDAAAGEGEVTTLADDYGGLDEGADLGDDIGGDFGGDL